MKMLKQGTSVVVTVKPITEKGKPSQEFGVFQKYERNVKDLFGRDVITYVVLQERKERVKPIEVKFYSHNIIDIKAHE